MSNIKSIGRGVGATAPQIEGFPLILNVALTTVLRTNVLHCDHCVSDHVFTCLSPNDMHFGESVALLVARRNKQSTNDRKVAGSRPTKVVCITVLTGNRMGVNCPLWPATTTSSEL